MDRSIYHSHWVGLGLASWHCLYPPAPPPIHPCRGSPKKVWTVLQALKPQNGRFPQKGNFQTNLVIQSDLFGWLSDPFKGVKWPPTRGWKGHFESPGTWFLSSSGLSAKEGLLFFTDVFHQQFGGQNLLFFMVLGAHGKYEWLMSMVNDGKWIPKCYVGWEYLPAAISLCSCGHLLPFRYR